MCRTLHQVIAAACLLLLAAFAAARVPEADLDEAWQRFMDGEDLQDPIIVFAQVAFSRFIRHVIKRCHIVVCLSLWIIRARCVDRSSCNTTLVQRRLPHDQRARRILIDEVLLLYESRHARQMASNLLNKLLL